MRLPVLIVALFLAVLATDVRADGPVAPDNPANPTEPGAPAAGPGFADGMPKSVLAFYKTLSYTAVVLTTDQIWYMVAASQAAATGGLFGVVNVVTSPMLTYAFEYTWDNCCELPPGPDGVVPVSATKAVIYRIVSTARVAAVALAFGNSLGSSLFVTGAIALTRTGVYLVNDYTWGHIDVRQPITETPVPPDAPRTAPVGRLSPRGTGCAAAADLTATLKCVSRVGQLRAE
jgi:hypothetical protein